MARVAGPCCLAGVPLLDCVPAPLSPVASMAPGDVCHGPRRSLAGLRPAALGYRPCCWPAGTAAPRQCTRPMGCGLLLPVPRSPFVCTRVRCLGPLGSCSPVCWLGVLCCVCGVLGLLAPADRCACSVRCVACVVCPGPLGSCSPVCPLGVLCCVCGVPGHLPPVHRCASSVGCVACTVSWVSWLLFPVRPLGVLCRVCGVPGTWLLFPGAPARCLVSRVRCPGPLGFCSPVCSLGALCCVCGVLGHLAPVHWCAHSVRRVACAVSWAAWLLFTGVLAQCVALCVCGVLGHWATAHWCARSVGCVVCAVSWATCLLLTGVPARRLCCVRGVLGTWLLFPGLLARCFVLGVRCPGPLGSCSPVCSLGVLCCVCGVLGHLAPVHSCAHSVRRVACAVSWAAWLLFTGVLAQCVALCVCGVLGHWATAHWCARSVDCVVCAVSWATCLLLTGVPARRLCCVRGVLGTWLLFPGLLARCFVLGVRCPGPLGSCSPVCSLGALCCVCGVLGHLAPVHWCAHSVRRVACAVSWAAWLLFTGVLAQCVALCVCGVLGHWATAHWCARSVGCVVCAVSWATCLLLTGVPARRLCCVRGVLGTWLLFPGLLARCFVLGVRCPGPLGSCSPVCSLGALCCVCGVLGHLAPVHWCAHSVRRVACAVS